MSAASVVAAAAARARPLAAGKGGAVGLRAALGAGAVGVESVVDLGAEFAGEFGGLDRHRLGGPVAGRGVGGHGRRRRLRLVALLGAVEQGIALQLRLDEGGELVARHLQELDRLQELRREDHRLALTHRKLRRQRHTFSTNQTGASAHAARFLLDERS